MDSETGDIEEPLSLNRYTYAANDPVNISDPSGHWLIKRFINKAKSTGRKVVKAAKKKVNTVKRYVKKKVTQVKTAAKKAAKSIKKKAANLYQKAKKTASTVKKKVCTSVKRVQKTAKKAIKNVDWKKVAIGAAVIVGGVTFTVLAGGAGAIGASFVSKVGLGAVIGGVTGGLQNMATGKSFIEGAATGVISGAVAVGKTIDMRIL